ncbi:gliding motility-associated C-terminal domain-containing protein [Candidatus Amoebophilus asiaticus]|nr:gliding motility-associated C-terminal domain-containing protein [Candidatus Amoebophilus asiaticus]
MQRVLVITVIVENLIDFPTAFTPNRDGKNDIIFVKGKGISKIELRIFNRGGEMVFETQDINQGWEGTFKGKIQLMAKYAYYLKAVTVDGVEIVRKGSITLIRYVPAFFTIVKLEKSC